MISRYTGKVFWVSSAILVIGLASGFSAVLLQVPGTAGSITVSGLVSGSSSVSELAPPPPPYGEPTPGYVAWHKADAMTGFADGDPVATWTDAGPEGHHLAQPAATQQPVYKANVLNGFPAVRFDGVDDVLTVSNALGMGNDFTVMAVLKLATGPPAATQGVLGNPTGFNWTWTDAGTEGYDLAQPAASQQPVYKANALNGFPAVRFDGVDDVLTVSNALGMRNDFTVIAVLKLATGPPADTQGLLGNPTGFNWRQLIARFQSTTDVGMRGYGETDWASGHSLDLDTYYVVTWRLGVLSTGSKKIRVNGIEVGSEVYTGSGHAPGGVHVGNNGRGGMWFKGDVAEILFYDNSLSEADMTTTEEYLGLKYGFITPDQIPPEAPTGLVATAADHQTIDLSWTDNSENEAGFRVERRTGQTGEFAPVDTVGANVTSSTDQPLSAETEYCYRTIATNLGGDSDPSDVACSTTPPPPPTSVEATAVSYGSIELTWTDNGTNEDGFLIERRQGQTGSWATIDTVATNTTLYLDDSSAILPQSEYCYRVTAFNANGGSSSSEFCTTTLAIPAIGCAPDTVNAREALAKVLTQPTFIEWRQEVGLSSANPNTLVLVTDDSLCQKIWVAFSPSPPNDQSYATFWQIGDLYILRDSLVAEDTEGWSFTAVFNSQFEPIGSVLAF